MTPSLSRSKTRRRSGQCERALCLENDEEFAIIDVVIAFCRREDFRPLAVLHSPVLISIYMQNPSGLCNA